MKAPAPPSNKVRPTQAKLVRIPAFFYYQLLDEAARQDTNVHALVAEAVKQYLGKLEGASADD